MRDIMNNLVCYRASSSENYDWVFDIMQEDGPYLTIHCSDGFLQVNKQVFEEFVTKNSIMSGLYTGREGMDDRKKQKLDEDATVTFLEHHTRKEVVQLYMYMKSGTMYPYPTDIFEYCGLDKAIIKEHDDVQKNYEMDKEREEFIEALKEKWGVAVNLWDSHPTIWDFINVIMVALMERVSQNPAVWMIGRSIDGVRPIYNRGEGTFELSKKRELRVTFPNLTIERKRLGPNEDTSTSFGTEISSFILKGITATHNIGGTIKQYKLFAQYSRMGQEPNDAYHRSHGGITFNFRYPFIHPIEVNLEKIQARSKRIWIKLMEEIFKKVLHVEAQKLFGVLEYDMVSYPSTIEYFYDLD